MSKQELQKKIEKIIEEVGEYKEEFACGLSNRYVVYTKQLAKIIVDKLGKRLGVEKY